jgi:transcriptional regulator with XRE-family HTH domain
MISIEQCRAARSLLDWSAQALADAASLGVATVRRFESGSFVQAASIATIERTLSEAGITFIAAGETSSEGGEGVRLTPKPE